MKRSLGTLGILLLLSGCATSRSPSTGDHWLVGTWLMIGEDSEFPEACASGLPISYRPDGRYDLFEERGTWRLDGDRLTETATEQHDSADEGSPEIGRPYRSTIRRDGIDAFEKTFADGRNVRFRRCPRP